MSKSLRHLLSAVLCAAMLAACSAGGPITGDVDWRDLDLTIPAGWQLLDQRDDLLFLANRDLRQDDVAAVPQLALDPDVNDVVAAQFTTDRSATADDWRGLISGSDGTIESDVRIDIDGVPATAITFRWVTNGVDTREQVVIVPSRDLVILLQPVPVNGQTTGPEVYLRHLAEFEALLASIDFGAPVS